MIETASSSARDCRCATLRLRSAGLWPILAGRRHIGDAQERTMSHQPPKESKKKPQHTPKEKKLLKQQKKHVGDAVPFIKH
jgi:hypothetical protein